MFKIPFLAMKSLKYHQKDNIWLYIPLVTGDLKQQKPEDHFKVRDRAHTFSNMALLRVSSCDNKKRFLCVFSDRDMSSKIMISVFFSTYSEVDFVSVHKNSVPPIFNGVINKGSLWQGSKDYIEYDAVSLLTKVHNLFLKYKDDDFNQPELDFFRYKLESVVLSAFNQKPSRHHMMWGRDERVPAVECELYDSLLRTDSFVDDDGEKNSSVDEGDQLLENQGE